MKTGVQYRPYRQGDEIEISSLIWRVFSEEIQPSYDQLGIDTFRNFTRAREIRKRLKDGSFILVAENAGQLVGIIEASQSFHIRLLFVDKEFHLQGVARTLIREVLETYRHRGDSPGAVTVNASPNAIGFYEKIGFERRGPVVTENGVVFAPMTLTRGEIDE